MAIFTQQEALDYHSEGRKCKIESGVVRKIITDWDEYKLILRNRVNKIHQNYVKLNA